MNEIPRALLADLSAALRMQPDLAAIAGMLDDLEYLLSVLLPDAHVSAPVDSVADALAAAADKRPSVIPGSLTADAMQRLRPLHTAIVEARSMAYAGDPSSAAMVKELATLTHLLVVNHIEDFDSALMELETAPLARRRLELVKGIEP